MAWPPEVQANVDPLPLYPQPTAVERALDLFFPPVCAGCRRVGRWICQQCWLGAPWTIGLTCSQCGRSSVTSLCPPCAGTRSHLHSLVAVARFEGVGREAVHALKFHDRHAISGMMGRLMARAVEGLEVDVVVPVPLHRRRLRERGYDQGAMLARSAARALELPYLAALERVRATQQQASLDAAARQTNVAGAFRTKETLHGSDILLVDDVSTTGATLNAAAEALKEAGAGRITGLVFAWAE